MYFDQNFICKFPGNIATLMPIQTKSLYSQGLKLLINIMNALLNFIPTNNDISLTNGIVTGSNLQGIISHKRIRIASVYGL